MPKFVIVGINRLMSDLILTEPAFCAMGVDEVFENMFNGNWDSFKGTAVFHYSYRRRPSYFNSEEAELRWDKIRSFIADCIQERADVFVCDYRFKKWLSYYTAIFEVKDYAPTAHCINFRP